MRRRVAVTGLGTISALGTGVAALRSAMAAGRCGIGPISTIPTDRLTVPIAAEILDFDPSAHFDRRQMLMLDRASQLALVAAREALDGIDLAAMPAERCGVVLGAAIGQTTMDAGYLALYGAEATRLPPLTVPRGMPSAAASQVAMSFGLHGPCFAIASACASSAHAIALAAQMVRAGQLDLAVCGGSDASICVGYLKAWDALRVLSADACRPFSRDRSGLVIGEAAGILVLEPWELARARGAMIHAEFLGCGMGADAGDLTAPSAEGAARAIRAALDDAGLAPDAVGYVNAHGTGTRLNDSTEAAALRAVFGAHLARLPVSSSKSLHGHCLNAAGGLEAVVTTLALREGLLPPTLGFREADPHCELDCVPNVARRASIGVALSNSFAFGGLNAVLALGAA
ncbi:MAG: beta-ACP synthase [Acetobacteraceae bacterium SCN 69-10]|nr:MAG: beta-ACP synthase [Acetobacteraceae bacterium SCN 69-10]OJY73506.1 MAG: beta-ACP synthase [Rhodospirillales bacterium 70-18]